MRDNTSIIATSLSRLKEGIVKKLQKEYEVLQSETAKLESRIAQLRQHNREIETVPPPLLYLSSFSPLFILTSFSLPFLFILSSFSSTYTSPLHLPISSLRRSLQPSPRSSE